LLGRASAQIEGLCVDTRSCEFCKYHMWSILMYGEVWGEALDKGWHLPILDRVSPTYYRVAPSMTEWHLPILDLSQNATHLSKSGTYYRVAPETEWHLLLQSGTYDESGTRSRVAPTFTKWHLRLAWHLKQSGTYFYRVAPTIRVAPETEWHLRLQSGTYDYRVAPTITEWHLKYSGTYFYRVAPHNNRQSGTPQ